MENVGWIYRWLPAAMYLAFLPICTALIQGQDSILLLLLFVGAFLCLYNGRDFCSRFFGGSRTLTFQLVVPVAVLFLLWGRWRFLGGFSVAAIAVAIVSVSLTGLSQAWTYLHLLTIDEYSA
jgi:hypothetical protein